MLSAISSGRGCATEEPSRHLLFLTLRKHRAGFKKDAEDVMEPLMCLGFSSGIQFYQETKVLVGLSAERNPGAVWLGWGLLCQGASSQQNQQHWAPPAIHGEFCKILSTRKCLPDAGKEREVTSTLKYMENQQKLNVICKWLINKPTKLIPVPHPSAATPCPSQGINQCPKLSQALPTFNIHAAPPAHHSSHTMRARGTRSVRNFVTGR